MGCHRWDKRDIYLELDTGWFVGFVNGGELDPTFSVWDILPVAVFLAAIDFHAIGPSCGWLSLERHDVGRRFEPRFAGLRIMKGASF